MQNIVLAKLETEQDTFYPPFGILYVADALEKQGYKVNLFHEIGNLKNIQKLLSIISEIKPLFIGLSVMTGPQLFYTVEASKLIKQRIPDLPIVWGGVHPTLLPRQCLEENFIDMVIVGEGEMPALELASALNNNEKKLNLIKGLGYKENGDIRINAPAGSVDLNDYFPSWYLVNLERYFRLKWGLKRILPVLISRGCVHRCGFCYNQAVHRKNYRSPSLEMSLRQVGELKKRYRIDGLMFFDDSFFGDTEKALGLVQRIDLPWFSEVRADYVNEPLLKEIKRYNCQELYVGAESGSQKILDIIHKDITIEDIIRCVKLCKEYRLELNLSFMSGIPGESNDDRHKTMDFIDYLRKIYRRLNIEFKIYTPYPRTPLWAKALEYGLKETRRTVDWATFQRGICNLPWIKNPKELETICYACNLANNQIRLTKGSLLKKILKTILVFIEKLRWQSRFFRFPIELRLLNLVKLKKRIPKMDGLKVLIITQKLAPDDAIMGFFSGWVNELAGKIDELYVLALENRQIRLPKNVKFYSAGKEEGSSRIRRFLRFNQVLARLLLGKKVNLILAHMCPEYAILAWPYARPKHIPIVMWYAHGSMDIKLRLAHLLVDKIITPSLESFRIKSKKVIITGHGIDTQKFNPPSSRPNVDKIGNNGKKIILSVGRISPIKNYETLIKSAYILVHQKNIRGLQFRIAGGIPFKIQEGYLDFLKHMVRRYNLEDYVQFVGPIPYSKIVNYYQNCDLFVSTSNTGSMDKVVLEAMACGKIALTCNEAFGSVLGEYAQGLAFKKRSPVDLAEKIINILNMDAQDRDRLAYILQERVVKNHSLNRFTENIITVFRKVLYAG